MVVSEPSLPLTNVRNKSAESDGRPLLNGQELERNVQIDQNPRSGAPAIVGGQLIRDLVIELNEVAPTPPLVLFEHPQLDQAAVGGVDGPKVAHFGN
jgi:hypothetical protein